MATPIPSPATLFRFGDRTTVEILQGNIIRPGRPVDIVVSTDDNYLTMGSGVSAALQQAAGSIDYVRVAQSGSPVPAGTVVVTESYDLKETLGADYVFHGAVVDYDTYDQSLSQLVGQVTAACLREAEARGRQSILFPALGTGAAMLSMEECARSMCSRIKAYIGQEHHVTNIYIILFRPDDQADAGSPYQDQNVRYIREANLILGVPFDPVISSDQIRDFFGAEQAIQTLTEIITGKHDSADAKQHAVILGGPEVGKWTVLSYLYYLAQQPGSPLAQGRRLVKLTFGRVHENTPVSFIYRKFLHALADEERRQDPQSSHVAEIIEASLDLALDCDSFLRFLDNHQDRYAELVFLIDKLPRLLHMEAKAGDEQKGVIAFWKDLDQLQTRLRFIYTARAGDYQELRKRRLEPITTSFQNHITPIWIECLSETARRQWVNELFNRYLDFQDDVPASVHEFFDTEAGRHPFLVGLAGYALVQTLKRDAFCDPLRAGLGSADVLAQQIKAAGHAIEAPRLAFYEELLAQCTDDELFVLQTLARDDANRKERLELQHELERVRWTNEKAAKRFAALAEQVGLRKTLDRHVVDRLARQGYLVDTDASDGPRFMAAHFGEWVGAHFGVGRSQEPGTQPVDVQFSLLSTAVPGGTAAPGEAQSIRIMFGGRGARISSTEKELHPDDKRNLVDGFSACINHLLHPVLYQEPSWLQDPGQVGNFILMQFASSEIKSYLQNPPLPSTVLFEVDDALKDIPWELMLETAYAGEIPFRVGRRIIGQQPANITPVVRGRPKIKALLIADPNDDLADARDEVAWLEQAFLDHGSFEKPDVLVGSQQCLSGPVLQRLGSNQYGLVHFSGHSKFDGYRSGWQLADGSLVTTNRLTNALQMGPPALVFSSSCASAAGGQPQAIRYENQTFDLPGAFLQAGVEAYIGTLWEVDSLAARRFVEAFYTAFLGDAENLGECLRRARWARKQDEQNQDQINWLSFILYGDPHLTTGELYPIMSRPEVNP